VRWLPWGTSHITVGNCRQLSIFETDIIWNLSSVIADKVRNDAMPASGLPNVSV
jgi:hypothetical protein